MGEARETASAVPESLTVATERLAVIAGSGVTIADLVADLDVQSVTTESGVVRYEGGEVVVLARHGADSARPAHRVDHAANLRALLDAGCDRVLALASTGSLRADWPVGTVVVPDDFTGNVVSDLNGRRGRIVGMEPARAAFEGRATAQIVKAEVPLAEMVGYSTGLRSATQGRATYTMQFSHYAEVGRDLQQQIIEKMRGY